MNKIKDIFKRIGRSFCSLFGALFAFKKKPLLSVTAQESAMSPGKIIAQNFFRKKLSIIGLVMLLIIISMTVILPLFIPITFEESYTQTNIAPGLGKLNAPKKLSKEGIEYIGVAKSFAAGLSQQGNVYVWGGDSAQRVPDAVKEANIIKLSVGRTFLVALDDNNTIYIWGDYYRDILDLKSLSRGNSSLLVEKIEDKSIDLQLSVYRCTSHIIKDICASNYVITFVTESGELFNAYSNSEVFNVEYPSIQGHVTSVYASDITIFALLDDGGIYPMGRTGEAVIKYIPIELLSKRYLTLEEDGQPSLDRGSGVRLYDDYVARTQAEGNTPISHRAFLDKVGTTKVKQIAFAQNHGLVLDSNNKLIIWGDSGNKSILNIPQEVLDSDIAQIAAGMQHFSVGTTDGTLYCWGNNTLNQTTMPKRLSASTQLFAGFFSTYSVTEEGDIEAWGHKGYIMGTDKYGRDLFTRIIHGGKMTMLVAAVAVAIATVLGLIIGLIAGYYGKWVDMILMRFSEIVGSFPFLPLAMVLSSIVIMLDLDEQSRLFMIMAVLGLIGWPGLASMVRGQILAEREKDFVLAATALGVKSGGIMWRHILPNILNLVIVNATLSYAGTLLTEAGLSFLGFGVLPPQPSWGNLLIGAQTREVLVRNWWQWIFPAMAVLITALSVNLIGDGLREAMDPKANER